jgi:hypothetical protein
MWCFAAAFVAVALLWQQALAGPKVGIEITTVPPWDPGGPDRMAPIAGRVVGDCKKCKVILYTHGDVWYVQPFENRPVTEIQKDGSWSNRIHLGTEYAALLTSADYQPLSTTGALPTGHAVLATSMVAGKKQ